MNWHGKYDLALNAVKKMKKYFYLYKKNKDFDLHT